MRYPEFIQEHGKVGFPAPSCGGGIEPYATMMHACLDNLKALGYTVEPGPNAFLAEGVGISNTPEKCAAEFMDFWTRDESMALLSCGGGELMCEILEHLDLEKMKAAVPKWFMGYSDNTNLLYLLLTACEVAGIYGPCASEYGARQLDSSVQDALDLFLGKNVKSGEVTFHAYEKYEDISEPEGSEAEEEEDPLEPLNLTVPRVHKLWIPSGKDGEGTFLPDAREWNGSVRFTGRLIGGCMDCLVNLLGTKFDYTKEYTEKYADDGFIWFLEACDLNVFSIRRAMWQMESAGWFHHVKGFLFGRALNGGTIANLDAYEAVLPYARKYNVPVILDTDLGHISPMIPLITGSLATVEAAGNEMNITMKLV